MPKKKHHIILGVVCLVISIVLPTLIYNYYVELKSLCEVMANYSVFEVPVRYGLLVTLLLIWFVTLMVALRELGGSVIQLAEELKPESIGKFPPILPLMPFGVSPSPISTQ